MSAVLTELLVASRNGDAHATDRVFETVYDELRRLAHVHGAQFGASDTLAGTALVHEAYFKLVDDEHRLAFENRAHFFSAASRAIRQLIVDTARTRSRQKRGGGARPVRLDDAPTLAADTPLQAIVALDEALKTFEALDPRAARVVECRYFAGLTIAETADALEVSTMTVKRDWAAARAWLHGALAAS